MPPGPDGVVDAVIDANNVIDKEYREPPSASSGVGCDLLEKRVMANNDIDGTIVIAVVVAVAPVDVIREVHHAAGAVATSTGRS